MKNNFMKKASLVVFSLVLASCKVESKNPSLLSASISQDTKFDAAVVDCTIEDFQNLGFELGDSVDVSFSNGYTLTDIPYFDGYYVKNAMPVVVAYPANKDILITYNNVGIWTSANLDSSLKVDITLNGKGKYSVTQQALSQTYSLERDSYESDEEFSNFRALSGGTLKDNFIYRGASPVDNSRKRAAITNSLLEKNSIASIVDLADSKDDMEKYFSEESFSSQYTKELYEDDKIALLSMGSGYTLDVYKKKVVEGIRHMMKTSAPYYIHCMEGKDRTGFVCTLIEALCGASYDEMCSDYMMTYQNYYKINQTATPEKYQAIVSLYFDSFMDCLLSTLTDAEKKKKDYQKGAENYLLEGGMTKDEITAFHDLINNKVY